jgi:hypothetical protein
MLFLTLPLPYPIFDATIAVPADNVFINGLGTNVPKLANVLIGFHFFKNQAQAKWF